MEKIFHDFFDKVIYINCDHRVDRRNKIEKIFNDIKFPMEKLERFPATYIPNNGIRGCAISHINVLNYIIENPEWKRVLIIEDDFYFKNISSIPHLEKFEKLVPEWDVLMLGYNKNPCSFISEKIDNNILRIFRAYSGVAYCPQRHYLVKIRDCFKNCLQETTKPKDYRFALDVQWNKLQKNDKWYGIFPKIAWQENNYSDIEKRIVDYSKL